MTNQDFAKELKAIDSRLSIIPNPNRPQLSNIKLDGIDICPIPSGEIRDLPDKSYFIIINDWQLPHKSRQEALALVNNTLENIKTPEGYANFYDK